MRLIITLVGKDLRRKLRTPLATIALILFSVFFSLIIGMTFGEGGGENLPPIKVLLVDEDESLIGGLVRGAFGNDQMSERFSLEQVERAKGEDLLMDGKASALLLIPEGFTRRILDGEPDTLFVTRNPGEGILPMVAQEMVEVLGLVLDSARRVFAGSLSSISRMMDLDELPSDSSVSEISVAANQTMRGVSRYIDPVIVNLEAVEREEEGEASSAPMTIALYVLPGIAVFSLLLIGQAQMRDILSEQSAGTLRRMASAPVTVTHIVLSKMVASIIIGVVALLFLSLVAVAWKAPSVDLGGFFLLSVVFVISASGFAALAYGAARNEREGGTVGHIILMVMAFLGGSWMPLEMLGNSIRRLSPFTLNFWAVDGYRRLLFEKAAITDLGMNFLVLGIIAFLTTAVGCAALRYRLQRGI